MLTDLPCLQGYEALRQRLHTEYELDLPERPSAVIAAVLMLQAEQEPERGRLQKEVARQTERLAQFAQKYQALVTLAAFAERHPALMALAEHHLALLALADDYECKGAQRQLLGVLAARAAALAPKPLSETCQHCQGPVPERPGAPPRSTRCPSTVRAAALAQDRRCQHCPGLIPPDLRLGTKYCKARCRTAAYKKRKALAALAAAPRSRCAGFIQLALPLPVPAGGGSRPAPCAPSHVPGDLNAGLRLMANVLGSDSPVVAVLRSAHPAGADAAQGEEHPCL